MSIQLYKHQEEAIEWMKKIENRPRMVHEQPHGGILAHAMGLGKTITVLSFILAQPPCTTLIICPKSVLTQWRHECLRTGFESAHVVMFYGAQPSLPALQPDKHVVVLSTYETVRIKKREFKKRWDRIVIDEAHRISEQTSKTARAICNINAASRWCVTGTPFKNGITDIVALARFLMVSPYSSPLWWKWYGNSVTKIRQWRLLFVHFREKSILTLDPLNQQTIVARLSPFEQTLYDSVTSSQPHELIRILKQRQFVSHPYLLLSPQCFKRQLAPKQETAAGMCFSCGSPGGLN